MPEDFKEVQLSEEQLQQLIYEERCKLYFELKDQQNAIAKRLEREYLMKPFSAEELKHYILSKNPKFVVDSNVEELFNLLCYYFTNDKRFEDAGYSLSKGIAISGVPGCGKTELLKLFQKNKVAGFLMININDIVVDCINYGIERYKLYCGYVPGWSNLPAYFFQQNIGWMVDDIGLEEMINDYGNKAFVFSKIIQHRYSKKEVLPFRSLHITTMLTPDQLEHKYGAFVRSRFREMFNYFHYKGEDRRR